MVPGTADVCCDDGETNLAEDEGALPMGRTAHRASLGVPGMVPPASRVALAGTCARVPVFIPTSRSLLGQCAGASSCAQPSVAMLRQPALLLQFDGPSLRRTVTAPSASRRPSSPSRRQQRAYSQGLLAAFRCQPCSR